MSEMLREILSPQESAPDESLTVLERLSMDAINSFVLGFCPTTKHIILSYLAPAAQTAWFIGVINTSNHAGLADLVFDVN